MESLTMEQRYDLRNWNTEIGRQHAEACAAVTCGWQTAYGAWIAAVVEYVDWSDDVRA